MARKRKTVADEVMSDVTKAQQEQAPIIPAPTPIMSPEQMETARVDNIINGVDSIDPAVVIANANKPSVPVPTIDQNKVDAALAAKAGIQEDQTMAGTVTTPTPAVQEQINEDVATTAAPIDQPTQQTTTPTNNTLNAQAVAGVTSGADLPKPREILDKKELEDVHAENKVLSDLTPEERLQYNAVVEAGQANVNDMISQLEETRRLHEEEQRIAEEEAKANRQRAIWGGATEMATALANLIGTAHGASNQTYQLQSPTWMREAETQRNMRRNRLDALRKQQMQAERDLNKAKVNAGASKADILATLSKQRIAEEKAEIAKQRAEVQNSYTIAREEATRLKSELDQKKYELQRAESQSKTAKNYTQIAKLKADIASLEKKSADANRNAEDYYGKVMNSTSDTVTKKATSAGSVSMDAYNSFK